MLKNLTCIAIFAIGNCCALEPILISHTVLRSAITHTVYGAVTFPLHAQVITMPLNTVDLRLEMAEGQREEVSSIAQRTGAYIAINGANYRRGGRYNGNRVNLLYANNRIYSDLGLKRGSVSWNNQTKSLTIGLAFLDATLIINGTSYPIDCINQPRRPGQAVLYTDVADPSLMNYSPGITMLIDPALTVRDIGRTAPKILCPGWYAYQADNEKVPICVGHRVSLSFALQSNTRNNDSAYDFVLGGAGLLIQDGQSITNKLYAEFSEGLAVTHCHDEVAADFHTQNMQEWLIEQRHPRTAIDPQQQSVMKLMMKKGSRCALPLKMFMRLAAAS